MINFGENLKKNNNNLFLKIQNCYFALYIFTTYYPLPISGVCNMCISEKFEKIFNCASLNFRIELFARCRQKWTGLLIKKDLKQKIRAIGPETHTIIINCCLCTVDYVVTCLLSFVICFLMNGVILDFMNLLVRMDGST